MTDIPPEAVTAAGNAMRERWLRDHPGIAALGLDPMDWAVTALEAAEPHIAAARRDRIIGYQVAGKLYHPADVVIVRRGTP